jgi:predicted TIM-barrel fold metal-dependent hydrolase
MAEAPSAADVTPAGWDCHAHLFGPYARYPLTAQRSYTPPEATQADYLKLLARLDLCHGVLVHPSAYGHDHALVLDALIAQPRWRGVLVSTDATLARMQAWHASGIRALRFSHRSAPAGNFAGSALVSDLQRLAPDMAATGLHAELWTDCNALPTIAPLLRSLPVPVVLDHMGGFDHRAGVDAPGFQLLLDLLGNHAVWVKLCAYRNLRDAPDIEIGKSFQQRLCEVNPEQLVWGSDWPHLNLQPAPATEDLMSQLRRWAGDPALERRILVDNPARLYA